jgi:hypothetical protein
MSKIFRNDSATAQNFWSSAEVAAAPARQWPDWKRAGINVSSTRTSSAPSKSETVSKADVKVEPKKG